MVDRDLPKRFAILIGIDFYSHGNARQDTKVKYHTLRGCVRDVDAVEDYIMNRLSVEKDCIRKLTASVPGDVQQNKPVEDVNTIPTYDNMVRAIKFVTEFASPGDLIYIHYSGHGAKVATIFTDLKGNTGIDEALVPTDICTGGRYLRDIEFRSLLAEMVHKQLNVTVTLDCCHSGVVATEGVVCRGISQVDATRLPSDEISEIPHYRILPKKQSWLLEPDGYDLFAAAHQNGKAYEMVFPGVRGGCHGALTYWMLDTLISRGNSTNRLLYQTTTNNIRARDPGNQCAAPQVPYFAGNAERYFYGFEDTQNTSSIAVGHVKGRRMTHIYAPYKGEYQIHQVKAVDRLYAMDWGKFSSDIAPLVFEPSRSTNDYKSNNFDTFTVEVNRDGMYELWSRTGTCIQPVPEFVPCSIADIFLSRMARVAQYQVIKDLKGTEHALMNGKLLLRVKGYEYDGSNETILDVKHGHQITMVFENHSEVGVYLTIFDLQPLWGITQIYPDVMDSEYVGPGHKREICMEVTLPAGITSDTAVDIIKAFATIDRMSFRALEIEDIDIHPDTEGPVERHSGLSTQSLYDQLTTTNGDAMTEGSCARVWQTAQISVRVSRSLDRDYRHPGSLNDVEENLNGQELVAREIANHLSTVIVTGIRDLVILPAPNHTKPGILKEMVQKVFNPGMSQSGNVMWRCRCGKRFTGIIPSDLAERCRSYQTAPHVTIQSSVEHHRSHESRRPDTQSVPIQDVFDIGTRSSGTSGSFVYLCVDKSSFFRQRTVSGFVPLPVDGCDDDFFRHIRTLYGKFCGGGSVRRVSSLKFVKFRRYRHSYVSCYERQELPPIAEGYSYYALSTPPMREDEMLHFLHSPQCIAGSTECQRRIPKKKTNEPGIDRIHGWGLYARERNSTASMFVSLVISSLITAYFASYLHLVLNGFSGLCYLLSIVFVWVCVYQVGRYYFHLSDIGIG